MMIAKCLVPNVSHTYETTLMSIKLREEVKQLTKCVVGRTNT